jgi:hypothetical protein
MAYEDIVIKTLMRAMESTQPERGAELGHGERSANGSASPTATSDSDAAAALARSTPAMAVLRRLFSMLNGRVV